jgi:hypothetical protein
MRFQQCTQELAHLNVGLTSTTISQQKWASKVVNTEETLFVATFVQQFIIVELN